MARTRFGVGRKSSAEITAKGGPLGDGEREGKEGWLSGRPQVTCQKRAQDRPFMGARKNEGGWTCRASTWVLDAITWSIVLRGDRFPMRS